MSEAISFEELAEMYLDLYRSGTAPAIPDYAAAHPEHADELLRLLPLMIEMESKPAVEQTVRLNDTSSVTAAFEAGAVVDLPDLRLTGKLGRGGMGTVFEAVQISLDRKVAVKLLSSRLLTDAAQRAQFEKEARMIAMLHHPNIVKILSAGCNAERCYYAMELIHGKPLDRVEFRSLDEIARIGLQAARAIAYAHRCSIMHRDIKPANLLLDADREVHICDFGIASILGDSPELVEESGSRSGTVRYMTPERLSKGINNYSADQYALGATLYELVTRAPLFAERTQKELVKRICSGPVPPLKCASGDLAAIINKSVSFYPEQRYPNMDEMAEDLRRFLNREPVAAASPSSWRRLQLWARRKPAVAALSLAVAICLVALFAASAVGYWRTKVALRRAERNAQAADETLSQVFRRMAELPPTPKNTQMLSSLLPYYRMIAAERNLSGGKLYRANAVVGELALRSGNFELAEASYRSMLKLREDAFPMNQLALALSQQGKGDEAKSWSTRVVDEFADSAVPRQRFEAVRALLALSDSPESAERSRAFGILEELLAQDPQDPELRFQYAQLLAGNPGLFRDKRIPGVVPNASELLMKLADAYPNRPEYGVAMVELMLKKLRRFPGAARRNRKEIITAVDLSERLLGRFPNDPQVVSAVTELHKQYIGMLRDEGESHIVDRVTDKLTYILEILFYNPEIPVAIKESLIRQQLEKLESLKKTARPSSASLLRAKLSSELENYQGPHRDEFCKRLEAIPEERNIRDGGAGMRPRRRNASGNDGDQQRRMRRRNE